MAGDKLSELQWRILRVLADLDPPWVLTGGGALAGFHLRHRRTRDLDLFWRQRGQLGEMPRFVADRLRSEGMTVEDLQRTTSFHRFRVTDADDTCMVDLVADPAPNIEAPTAIDIGGASILVDSGHEILVNKLCSLLSRSELRDLQDVKALLEAGGSLERAAIDAPHKDGGFSVLTLAWLVREMHVGQLAASLGWAAAEVDGVVHFQGWLVERLLKMGRPSE